jgi:hypothetical protein
MVAGKEFKDIFGFPQRPERCSAAPVPHFELACPGNKRHFQLAVMDCFFHI